MVVMKMAYDGNVCFFKLSCQKTECSLHYPHNLARLTLTRLTINKKYALVYEYVCLNCHLICGHDSTVCDGAACCHDRVRSHHSACVSDMQAVCSYSQDACFKNNMHLQRKESSDWKQISEAPAAVENTYMKGRAQAYIDHKLMSSSSRNM